MVSASSMFLGLAGLSTAFTASAVYPTLEVRDVGVPVGEFKNVSGINTYISYPPGSVDFTKAIIHVSDISGLPSLKNRLLADSLAANGYLVVVPDLFAGGAVNEELLDASFDLPAFGALHPVPEVDRIINSTLGYMRNELAVKRVGGFGTYFGGRFVPRFLTQEGGIDIGFIGHPYNLTTEEISGITKPISIAAGTLDSAFNTTWKIHAESILNSNNVTFQSSLFFGAHNGFTVRANMSIPAQAYAKRASFVQAVTWFDTWL